MERIEFYQSHLNRTSRSFAFCIEQLDHPFRHWISLSYLLCRVLDTIEDTKWPTSTMQAEQYLGFRQFLAAPASEVEIASWISRFPSDQLGVYAELMQDSGRLFHDLHELPPKVRASMQKNILKMLEGMGVYSSRNQNGVLRLANLVDVNRYCYFVAGVVGDLITQLYTSVRPELAWNKKFALNSNHFGLFLQKVNLLKDHLTDEKEGRFLIPDRRILFASLEKNAKGAIEYLTSLPVQDRGFRLFCGWSIFLGLASLSLMQNSQAQELPKLPRALTQALCAEVSAMIDDNERLKSVFEQNLPHANLDVTSKAGQPEPWLKQLVGQELTESDLQELGMC